MNYQQEIDLSNITAEQWSAIYDEGGYDGCGSGPGSLLENNYLLINWLQKFIRQNKIKSIVDVGCGDLQWVSAMLRSLPEVSYIGIDGAQSLITQHTTNYPQHTFLCRDITEDELLIEGEYDLVICKDVLQHNLKNTQRVLDCLEKINSSHRLIICPYTVDAPTWDFPPENCSYTWIFSYQSDEHKRVFINS